VTPLWYKREITLGMEGPDVRVVRRKLGFIEDGPYDRSVQQKVVGMARKRNVETDGEVNPEVAEMIGETEANQEEVAPVWWTREIDLWEEGEDVRELRVILGLGDRDNRYDPDAEALVRQFQSAHHLPISGKVDIDTARAIGER
jgi:peptidoglycan hydrolase-like protein with peptidoglycan-binding domain